MVVVKSNSYSGIVVMKFSDYEAVFLSLLGVCVFFFSFSVFVYLFVCLFFVVVVVFTIRLTPKIIVYKVNTTAIFCY